MQVFFESAFIKDFEVLDPDSQSEIHRRSFGNQREKDGRMEVILSDKSWRLSRWFQN
jgi:hypothetical protein